jgi:hypothetical protein
MARVLTFQRWSRTYIFNGGDLAVFRIHDGRVRPLTRDVTARRGVQPIDGSAFLDELKRFATLQ